MNKCQQIGYLHVDSVVEVYIDIDGSIGHNFEGVISMGNIHLAENQLIVEELLPDRTWFMAEIHWGSPVEDEVAHGKIGKLRSGVIDEDEVDRDANA